MNSSYTCRNMTRGTVNPAPKLGIRQTQSWSIYAYSVMTVRIVTWSVFYDDLSNTDEQHYFWSQVVGSKTCCFSLIYLSHTEMGTLHKHMGSLLIKGIFSCRCSTKKGNNTYACVYVCIYIFNKSVFLHIFIF